MESRYFPDTHAVKSGRCPYGTAGTDGATVAVRFGFFPYGVDGLNVKTQRSHRHKGEANAAFLPAR